MKDSLYLAPKQGVPGSLTTISGILLENKETFLRWINTFVQLFKLRAEEPRAGGGGTGGESIGADVGRLHLFCANKFCDFLKIYLGLIWCSKSFFIKIASHIIYVDRFEWPLFSVQELRC